MSSHVHQEVEFQVPPSRVYDALTQAALHGAFTASESTVSPEVGAAFSAHGGQITGRNLDLLPNERIVQAWRVEAWPAGVFSVVRYDLSPTPKGTKVVLEHTGLPEGASEMIGQGWHARYWTPMREFFAAS